MSIALIGFKRGMTRVFTENGESIPVSVVEVKSNRIVQMKTIETDGYTAIQVTMGDKKTSKVNKAEAGHYAKNGVAPGVRLCEFRIKSSDLDTYQLAVANEIKIETVFKNSQLVDVSGVTKGKGFAGAIKRHHFSSQDASHGNSLSHRAPGSIGQNQTPRRVFKGKRMAGHMGDVQRTVQNLEIVRIDQERNLILIKGAIPGATGGFVIVKPAVKAKEGR